MDWEGIKRNYKRKMTCEFLSMQHTFLKKKFPNKQLRLKVYTTILLHKATKKQTQGNHQSSKTAEIQR